MKNLPSNRDTIDRIRAEREWDSVLVIVLEPFHLGESKDNLSLIFFIMWVPCPSTFFGGRGNLAYVGFFSFPTERVFNSRAMGCHEMVFYQERNVMRLEIFEDEALSNSSWRNTTNAIPVSFPKSNKEDKSVGLLVVPILHPVFVKRPNITVVRGHYWRQGRWILSTHHFVYSSLGSAV